MVEHSSQMPASKLLERLRTDSPLDSHEFIQGLAALFFLRWADFQEAEFEAIAAFDDIEYEPVLPPSLHWRTWHSLPPDELSLVLSKLKNVTFHKLYNSRNSPLATHLHHLAGSIQILEKLSPNCFKNLIEWLAAQPFETPTDRHQLLDTFDEILQSNQDKHRGEFRTPNHVVRLMVALAAPARGESIYDPCFGSAGLLTGAIDYALQKSEQGKVRYDQTGLRISGIEQNESAYTVGLTRLVLAGCDDPQLEHNNSLLRPPLANPSKEGFDVVLANPPWGWTARMDERYGLEHYPVMTKDGTGLFIQHALSNLRPNGRAVVAVPNGILFRSGAEQKLREWLIAHHTVEAVVSLPETTFGSSTAIKASLLVLRRGGTTRRIRMVEADAFFEKGKGRQPVTISESQIVEIVGKVRAARPSESSLDIEIETLVETNYDLTPRRRDQSGLVDIIASLGPSVEIARLKDCCREIMLGRQIRATDLVDELPNLSRSPGQQKLFAELEPKTRQQSLFEPVEPIPYIRIKDINKGQANKGSSWVSPAAASGVEGHWKLRAGDVLLSKSGTIGKVGVVRNGSVGAVAASGLYVLRTVGDRLDPHYLAAYLDSADGKAWLQDRASGGVISHLTKRIIEDLPVPLPPLQIQHQVATMWREHGEDALTCLAQLLSKEESDPILEWLDKELKNFPAEPESLIDPLNLVLLDQLASHVKPLRNEAAHGRHSNSVLLPWILSINEAVASLRGVGNLPKGPALLSVLQESALGLMKAKETLKGHLPSESKARKLTDILARWLNRANNVLFDSVQLSFGVETSTLVAGESLDIDMRVDNVGPMPLRNIEVTLEPEWGLGSIAYLAENSSEILGLQAAPPKSAGQFTLLVNWSAHTLDGRQVDGSREIVFEVVSASMPEEHLGEDLGASPYVCGDPVRPERNDVFFGREALLDQIRRQIIQSGNVVLLEGNRRAGKSSILRHLEGAGPVPGWLGVYCSLQGAEGSQTGVGVPTSAVFREIAISIAKSMAALNIEVPLPDGSILPPGKKIGIARACRNGISEEHPFADFRDYAETALETVAGKQLSILLMLDEFDKLQEGIDNNVTSPQVPENIRFMVQTYPGFSAILTGSRRLKRLREEYWSALFGLGTRFGVTSLSPEAAGRLVIEPVKGRLVYSREAIDKAIMLTNRQPFLLQSLCNRVFDMAAQLKTRSITLDVIEEAANMLADDNEHFRSLWSYAETDRRRFILGLIHKESAGPDSLRFGFLLELLSTHGVEVDEEALSGDLEFLRELELIDLVGESVSGHYVLAIPLMGKWIGRQHDFEVLRNKARMETEENHG
jgi:type I restriction enzyme M protein